jgi:hypothetical protein
LKEDRRILVDRIHEVGENLRIRRSTIHSAVTYLDRILSVSRVHKCDMILLALTCLHLATKFEEKYDGSLSVINLLSSFGKVAKANNIKEVIYVEDIPMMEATVLEGLGFRLRATTAAHYLDMIGSLGYFFHSESGDRVPQWMDLDTSATLTKTLSGYAEFFVDIALQYVDFQSIPGAALAMAVIGCARRVMGIYPLIPTYLETVTGLKFDTNIRGYQEQLWTIYGEEYLESPSENAANAVNVSKPTMSTTKGPAAMKPSPDGVEELNTHALRKKQSCELDTD